MKAGVVHCRCPKCSSIPARKRLRKRPQCFSLLSLPEEVLLCVLQCLSAEDLLSVRAVHSQLRDIVDNHSSLWARVSFKDTWPCPNTLWLFKRAAEKGNFEAAVKLGIAYLYNEGPLLSDEGRADVCGHNASHYFSLAESLRSPSAYPFIWVFIRPPWSPTGSCCKAVVYDRLTAECETNMERRGTLLYCLARVLQLFEDERRLETISALERSSQAGCLHSSYLLWEHNQKAAKEDPGRYLQSVRTLRDYANKGCWEAQLSLAKLCSSGNPLGLDPKACSDLVAQVFSARPGAQGIRRRTIKDSMRYILVDWLVEVTTMKDFSSLALHVTVGCVDRYLALRSVPKARLQLLGIACMVICTRYISNEILTIREAVWLTDNTYKYEDLVRMMGEIVAVLEGNIRCLTVLDFAEVLKSLLPLEKRTIHLFSYICELLLLFSTFTVLAPAKLACSALLLSRALHHYAPVWPSQLVDYTGFSKQELVPLSVLLYMKCFSPDVPKDYRHVSLTGVKQRFEDEAYQQISKEEVMDLNQLCQMLEISAVQPEREPPSPTGQAFDIHTFLASPSSSSKRRRDDARHASRASLTATPTAELSRQEETLLGDIMDWSLDTSSSGYEGDQESETERAEENVQESYGEKRGDVSMVSAMLQLLTEDNRLEHCRAQSSDEDSFCEAEREACAGRQRREPLSFSSGYSSVQSTSPPPSCSSSSSASSSSSSSSPLMLCTFNGFTSSLGAATANAEPGFRLLVPIQRPRGTFRKQVKRKNVAAHSRGEVDREEDGEDGEDTDEHAVTAGCLSF